MTFIEELRWRGMIQDIMPGTEEQLKKELTTGYVGFDPTGESLHIGHLVPILLLVHLQRAGHKPVALVGGATGMIGDPSGKSQERNLLGEEQLAKNVAGIRRQLEKFLDFNSAGPNAAELVNNYDWFREMSFIDFLRDIGKHITINYMMAKDSVKKRIEGEVGLSYTEFAYQLLQGYDFYWLYKHKGLKLQMGGSDQWGNITTGTELVRRMAGGEAFAFTCPLITKADGGKFGKTESGNVWIDPNLTTPYQFYQFWLNASDADAERWIKIFTFVPKEEIESLIEQHQQDPGARLLQKRLAEELTVFVHSREALDSALATTAKIFENQSKPASEMSVEDLESLQGIVKADFEKARLEAGVDAVSLLAETNIYPSKGEAKKAIIGGGVSINRIKLQQPQQVLDASQLLHGEYLLVQKGKKNYFLVRAV